MVRFSNLYYCNFKVTEATTGSVLRNFAKFTGKHLSQNSGTSDFQ